MGYDIVIARQAKKQIDALPSNVKSRIGRVVFDILTQNPFSGKSLKADLEGLYSYRVGDYRIVYSIMKHEFAVQIVKVMHRKEVYR